MGSGVLMFPAAGSISSLNRHLYVSQLRDCPPSESSHETIQLFDNTATSVAASQMRNSLNKLADTMKDPGEKKVFRACIGQM